MADFDEKDFSSFGYLDRIGKFETSIAYSKEGGNYDLLISVDYISNENIKNNSFEKTQLFTKLIKDNYYNDDYDYQMCRDITKLCGVFEVLTEKENSSKEEESLKKEIAIKLFFNEKQTLDRRIVNELCKKSKKYVSKEELKEKKKQGEELGDKVYSKEKKTVETKMKKLEEDFTK